MRNKTNFSFFFLLIFFLFFLSSLKRKKSYRTFKRILWLTSVTQLVWIECSSKRMKIEFSSSTDFYPLFLSLPLSLQKCLKKLIITVKKFWWFFSLHFLWFLWEIYYFSSILKFLCCKGFAFEWNKEFIKRIWFFYCWFWLLLSKLHGSFFLNFYYFFFVLFYRGFFDYFWFFFIKFWFGKKFSYSFNLTW